jgi:hypothetical protein
MVVDLKKSATLIAVAVFMAAIVLISIAERHAGALELTNRFVEISSALPSQSAAHNYQFFVPSTTTLGSIVFEYCSNSPLFNLSCIAPAGLDVSNASLLNQSGNTGFGVDSADTTANRLVVSRLPLNGAAITSSYLFANITNPSSSGTTTFVRISTHASNDGSGPVTDSGAVAFVTQTVFSIGAAVPPFLQLCVGVTVSLNCSAASGDSINLGILSAKQANSGQSQFAAATNSPTGYIVYSLGTTMTSGNNSIQALGTPSVSLPGSNQFGINLRANSIPAVGQNVTGGGTAAPTANYNQQNFFKFSDGDAIAASSLPSDYNLFTASYLVNVSSGQAPGVYSTTITYLGVGQF